MNLLMMLAISPTWALEAEVAPGDDISAALTGLTPGSDIVFADGI